MNRIILLAIPCDGADEAACVADFIKTTGITDTDFNFDVIEDYSALTRAIEPLVSQTINPSETLGENLELPLQY